METKHTKGKWIIEDFYNGSHIYSIGKKICSVWDSVFSITESKANAKLIVAAPELLEKLIELVDKMEELATIVHLVTYEQGMAIINAKEAIKKATE